MPETAERKYSIKCTKRYKGNTYWNQCFPYLPSYILVGVNAPQEMLKKKVTSKRRQNSKIQTSPKKPCGPNTECFLFGTVVGEFSLENLE